VTVRDTTPPEVTCPANVNLTCVDGGAVASYSASVRDNCGASVTCSPASGASFPAGTTAVSCSAVDSAGNSATCAFPVSVQAVCPQQLKVTMCGEGPSNPTNTQYTRNTSFRACGYVTSGTGGPPVSAVYVIVNGGEPIPVAPTPENRSSGFVETYVDLQDGKNVVQLVGRDNRGYLTIKTQTVYVDRQAPSITVLSPLEGERISSGSVRVRVRVEDASPDAYVSIKAGAFVHLPSGTGEVERLVTFTSKGTVSIPIDAKDKVNNSIQQVVHVLVE
jgi:subtilisin family serine protease